MQLAGLIGNPVAHSRSPAMHNAAFASRGIEARYDLWLEEADTVPQRLQTIRETGAWANVTVPHKELVFGLVDELSETAQAVQAVNTIIPDGQKLTGDNTDVYGFTESLKIRHIAAPQTAIVLGAGGASKAILVALSAMNVERIFLANRTRSRADDLVRQLHLDAVQVVDSTELESVTPGAGLVVNATSVGWHDDALPLSRESFDLLPENAIAYDLTYRETAFLRAATDRGLLAIDGLDMLVLQGARSFELWTGIPAPVDVMRAAATQ